MFREGELGLRHRGRVVTAMMLSEHRIYDQFYVRALTNLLSSLSSFETGSRPWLHCRIRIQRKSAIGNEKAAAACSIIEMYVYIALMNNFEKL